MRLKDAPQDVSELAHVLGYSQQALVGLRDKHGARLLVLLQREWWEAQDRPRLLHRDSSHGYTESPSQSLPSEPEAVPEKYQEELSTEARKRFMESKALDRQRLDRLRRNVAQAKKRGLDISPHLAAIEARIRMIEAELDQAA